LDQPSLITFAFLGVYFFALQLVWQGDVRADLRPKTYTTIAVRVLVVVVVAWLIDATTGASENLEPLYLLAFAAGFVPDQVLHLLWEKVLPRLSRFVDQGRQQQLTELEGINLYERTRLGEESITSVEALAHHDLLDLFIKTRIAAEWLMDWVDQAILVICLSADKTKPTFRDALRKVGIRTASELVKLTKRNDRTSDLKLNDLAGVAHLYAVGEAGSNQVLADAADRNAGPQRVARPDRELAPQRPDRAAPVQPPLHRRPGRATPGRPTFPPRIPQGGALPHSTLARRRAAYGRSCSRNYPK
jgi:hypothetical protein